MTKTLKQIQEENREFIIMANSPTAKNYKEAFEMELNKLTTTYREAVWEVYPKEYIFIEDQIFLIDWDIDDPYDNLEYVGLGDDFFKVVLTLNRVLIALKLIANNEYGFARGHIIRPCMKPIPNWYECRTYDWVCEWDLTKETLEEQSERTQRKINELLRGNK